MSAQKLALAACLIALLGLSVTACQHQYQGSVPMNTSADQNGGSGGSGGSGGGGGGGY
jgi:hypothetical protein